MPISFQLPSKAGTNFSVGRNETYEVDVYFQATARDRDSVLAILGGVMNTPVRLALSWQVTAGKGLVASGSTLGLRLGQIGRADETGGSIGWVRLRRGIKYDLLVTQANFEPGWDSYHPYVAIALHPASLEYLLGYFLLGAPLAIVSAVALLGCSIAMISRRRSAASVSDRG